MDFAATSCFVKMIIRSDTPPPKGKLLQALLGRTDRYGSLSRNRNDVMNPTFRLSCLVPSSGVI